jgi:hypothetical protein
MMWLTMPTRGDVLFYGTGRWFIEQRDDGSLEWCTEDDEVVLVNPENYVTEYLKEEIAPGRRMLQLLIGSIAMVNDVKRIIVEERPKRMRDPKKAAKIPRLHERPRFTVLLRPQIDRIFPFGPEHTGKKKRPHRRRAHTRTYRSVRYRTMKGRSVKIPACWVGPTEVRKNGKKYIVRLDVVAP